MIKVIKNVVMSITMATTVPVCRQARFYQQIVNDKPLIIDRGCDRFTGGICNLVLVFECCSDSDAEDHGDPVDVRDVDPVGVNIGYADALTPGKQPRASACLTKEKVADIMAWLATTSAPAATWNMGQYIHPVTMT